MVLGLGEMILPHFPPPTITTSNRPIGIAHFLCICKATGATVIIATSINTPIAHSNRVDSARAIYTYFSPSFRTIVLEMDSAAPVFINTPDNTPAARIRRMAGVMSFTPSTMTETLSTNDSPPDKPPVIAPIIRL